MPRSLDADDLEAIANTVRSVSDANEMLQEEGLGIEKVTIIEEGAEKVGTVEYDSNIDRWVFKVAR